MKPKWMNAKFITVAQISQMVVGVTVTLLCFRYYRISASLGRHCWVGSDNNAAACVMKITTFQQKSMITLLKMAGSNSFYASSKRIVACLVIVPSEKAINHII
eukprot:scaffold552085_cov67-Attheya_sp.AAC.1